MVIGLRLWAYGAASWSLVFAAVHLYWAFGGRAGLRSESAAADAAFAQTWFALYNFVVALLGIAGVAVALALSRATGRAGYWPTATAWIACVLLGARGVVGLTLLGVSVLRGGPLAEQAPPLLLIIEPWFVLGAGLFGLTAWSGRKTG